MGICKHCGAATTLEGTVHGTCQQLHAQGYSDADIGRIARGEAVPARRPPEPVTYWTIVGAEFVGNLLFSVTAYIFFSLVHLINDATTPLPPH